MIGGTSKAPTLHDELGKNCLLFHQQSVNNTETIVYNSVWSKLDYCNAVFYGSVHEDNDQKAAMRS